MATHALSFLRNLFMGALFLGVISSGSLWADEDPTSTVASAEPPKHFVYGGVSIGDYSGCCQPGIRLGLAVRLTEQTPIYLGFDKGSYINAWNGPVLIDDSLGTFYYRPRFKAFTFRIGLGIGIAFNYMNWREDIRRVYFMGVRVTAMAGVEYHLNDTLSIGVEMMAAVMNRVVSTQPLFHATVQF